MAFPEGAPAGAHFFRMTHEHRVMQRVTNAGLGVSIDAARTAAAKALTANGEPARAAIILRRVGK